MHGLRPIVLLLVLAAPLDAQMPGDWPALVRRFDAYAVSDSSVGASLLVLRDGRILAHHEYGFADRAHALRTEPATIYHRASITKTLTAIAIFQLRDRGLVSLDDPVTRWVPELRQVHDSFGPIDAITIRMLLGHSAGLQSPTWPYGEGRPWEPFEPTRWEQLVAMMPYQEIHFAPDSRYGYSNPGVVYLARTGSPPIDRTTTASCRTAHRRSSRCATTAAISIPASRSRTAAGMRRRAIWRPTSAFSPVPRAPIPRWPAASTWCCAAPRSRRCGAAGFAAFNTSNDVQPDSSGAGFNAVRDAALALLATLSASH